VYYLCNNIEKTKHLIGGILPSLEEQSSLSAPEAAVYDLRVRNSNSHQTVASHLRRRRSYVGCFVGGLWPEKQSILGTPETEITSLHAAGVVGCCAIFSDSKS